jgi:hypothetical protein
MSEPTIQEIALIDEVDVAISFIDVGLTSLKRLATDDFAHLPILLLSNGFERLLKMIICLDYREQNGEFPNTPDFRKEIKTHNVEELLQRVVDISKTWECEKKTAETKDDMDFLENDAEFQRIVKLLTGYGSSSRYYNINIIIGKKNSYGKPAKLLEDYCWDFDKELRWEENITTDNIRCFREHITRHLQQFRRALCRMFIWGKLGQTGKEIGESILVDIIHLRDEDLGQVKTRCCEY